MGRLHISKSTAVCRFPPLSCCSQSAKPYECCHVQHAAHLVLYRCRSGWRIADRSSLTIVCCSWSKLGVYAGLLVPSPDNTLNTQMTDLRTRSVVLGRGGELQVTTSKIKQVSMLINHDFLIFYSLVLINPRLHHGRAKPLSTSPDLNVMSMCIQEPLTKVSVQCFTEYS
ncbi:hypothetical protein CDEST_10002 [Colletotrichum destructivum]|uniref:Uncharacterized protein n=1 Tax=Colletotrichum destructivum TaxID=34406 RepID=A0AAX4IPQ2_9PEZI|nr:hypothetical protein CDEST_10002 [Colletotrichum destructivum]